MNSGPCCKNTGSSGTSDMCGIEFGTKCGVRFYFVPSLPQRGSITKPRVARNELPRENVTDRILPQRGSTHLMGRRPSTWRTQPRWGWILSGGRPGVARRSSGQPRALRKIPVGEIGTNRHQPSPTVTNRHHPSPTIANHELPPVH
jgi:hypothetical protein